MSVCPSPCPTVYFRIDTATGAELETRPHSFFIHTLRVVGPKRQRFEGLKESSELAYKVVWTLHHFISYSSDSA